MALHERNERGLIGFGLLLLIAFFEWVGKHVWEILAFLFLLVAAYAIYTFGKKPPQPPTFGNTKDEYDG